MSAAARPIPSPSTRDPDFSGANFVAVNDGYGGTAIEDPAVGGDAFALPGASQNFSGTVAALAPADRNPGPLFGAMASPPVTDGAPTVNLTLLGQYVASQFNTGPVGSGGTLVTTRQPRRAMPSHRWWPLPATGSQEASGGNASNKISARERAIQSPVPDKTLAAASAARTHLERAMATQTIYTGLTGSVSSGETDTNDLILGGGTLFVDNGGTAIASTLSGGAFRFGGARQIVYGAAIGTTISWGIQTIESGALAIGTVMGPGAGYHYSSVRVGAIGRHGQQHDGQRQRPLSDHCPWRHGERYDGQQRRLPDHFAGRHGNRHRRRSRRQSHCFLRRHRD